MTSVLASILHVRNSIDLTREPGDVVTSSNYAFDCANQTSSGLALSSLAKNLSLYKVTYLIINSKCWLSACKTVPTNPFFYGKNELNGEAFPPDDNWNSSALNKLSLYFLQ